MNKVTLYKLDSKGKQRQWSIEVVGDFPDGVQTVGMCLPPMEASPIGRIIIETGLVEGKKVVQTIDITEGKNLGKANATTPYTQAVSEAEAKLELQLRSGYVYNLEDVKESGTLGSGLPQCMLAQKHDPTGEQKGSKTLDKMGVRGKEIHVQPKLDGNRCLIKVKYLGEESDGVQAVMYTRKGDVMPVQLTEVLTQIVKCYNYMFRGTDVMPELIFDGELFSDKLSFNELNGHLKRKDSQDPEALAKIKYHVYDCMENLPYDERLQNIINFFGKAKEFGETVTSIKIIESFPIVATDENIKTKLEEFLAEGHEGLMIRTLDKGYENKRAWQLCKVKLFSDEEFKLLDLELDSMGRLGAFIMEMSEPSRDRDGKTITTFKAGTTGMTHEEGLEILKNKDKYIGSLCTIEFFGLSEYAVPRFPKMKQLNRLD